jgi:hypothetical protein
MRKGKFKKLQEDIFCAVVNFISIFAILFIYLLKIIFLIIRILLIKKK